MLRGDRRIIGTLVGDNNTLVRLDGLHVRVQHGGQEHVENLRCIE
jgi:hypothetical protein